LWMPMIHDDTRCFVFDVLAWSIVVFCCALRRMQNRKSKAAALRTDGRTDGLRKILYVDDNCQVLVVLKRS
jgi:hypothetical protein